jgi:hypothetical protein
MLNNTQTTDELWTATHTALCERRWNASRALLDTLCQRRDVTDCLSNMEGYGMSRQHPQYAVFQDRINHVNQAALS